jgi:cobaltochelatase CobS
MSEDFITCQVPGCGEATHVINPHLAKHDGWTLERYQKEFPAAPVMSEKAKKALADRTAASAPKAAVVAPTATKQERVPFHEAFGFDKKDPKALSSRGTPIGINVFDPADYESNVSALIPDRDKDYVFDIDLAKTVVMALEMNIPIYLWGHAGVGKTTMYEQVAAITNRPFTRVQHTANMEEGDVEGRLIVNAAGVMEFQNGPLVDAMEQGHVYCADEYDFAPPMVLSCYQAVLEGKPLFVKAANKKVVPHKNFRFVASGNTNGAGDETGLYQGTMMQNAANYERFGVVERVKYMPAASEIAILTGKTNITKQDAENVVKFATAMREGYDKRDVAIPMSPRASLNAAKLGTARADMKYGITVAYINRLPETSADVAKGVLQRLFG